MLPGNITIVGREFVVKCQPHIAIKLRRVFGGAQRGRETGVFRLAATPTHAHELEWFATRHPMVIDPAAIEQFAELVATEERKLAAIAEVEAVGYVPREFALALPPRDYQRIAADMLLRTRQLLLADDLGVGKTVSAICALTAPGALPAAVVTMTHLPRQWEREINRFLPGITTYRVRKGTPYAFDSVTHLEEDANGKRRRVRPPKQPDVLIINYAKLDGWADHLAGMVRTLIFDECQELRHGDSDRYRAAAALAGAVDTRMGLSATPIYNYGPEIYAVLGIIAPGALGSREEFFQEWCGGGGSGSEEDRRKICVKDPVALGTYLRESGLMLRRTRRDVGRELPAMTIVRHVVEVNQDRINEVAVDVAELAKRVLERTGTNFEIMKWSGDIDYRMRQATGIGKAPAVAEFVRLLVESGERVVLYGWHHEVYSIWRSVFDKALIGFAMYTGQESESQKAESVRKFIAREVPVLIISLRSGAGLDGLQHVCRTVVVGELDWSPQVHEQGDGRVHRDGQLEPVTSYYLVADEGSDPVIADTLGVKASQSRGIRDPNAPQEAVLVGASADHVKRLAEDILRRYGAKTATKAEDAA